MKTSNPTKILSLILLLMAAQVSISYAANLFIDPASPLVQVGGQITLTVTNASGEVMWSAFKGKIEGTGNTVKYKATDYVTIDSVSILDSSGNTGIVTVKIQEKAKIDERFLKENANWEIFTNRSAIPSLLLSDDKKTLWVGTTGGLEERNAGNGQLKRVYTTLDGLPSNEVESLLSDGQGGVWVGTYSGLARLSSDGNWTVFDESGSGLPDNTVYSLLSDGQGGVWVGTDGGLARLGSDGSWTVFDKSGSGLPSNFVVSLLSDGQGGVWVGTWGGLARLGSDGSWTVFDTDNSGLPADNTVYSLLSDGQGGVWVGTDGGLARLGSDGSWTVFDTDNSGLPADNTVYSLLSDGQGGVWVGTYGGLARLSSDGSWTLFDTDNSGLPDNRVTSLLSDGQGGVWVGTWGGLARLGSDGNWTVFDTDNSGLPDNRVTSLLSDGQGGVWVGTWGGLARLGSDGNWTVFDTDNSGLPYNFVDSLLSDGQGGVWVGTWVGTWGGGLARLSSDGNWTVFDESGSGLPDNDVNSLLSDGQGGVWVGRWGGLARLGSDGSWTVFDKSGSGLPDNWVTSLLSDGQGGVWVGTYGGLARLGSDGSWTLFDTDNSGLPDNDVNSLLSDGQGGVWVGTDGGLARLGSDGNWTVFDTDNSGLPDNSVESLLSDGQGGVWVGTWGGGLARLGSDGSWTVFDKSGSGLPSNFVVSLLSDGQGGVWVGTWGGGLARLTFSSAQIQDEQYLKNGRAAIIIAGGGNSDDNLLWDSTEKISNYAYKMLNRRGFFNTDIHYISPKNWADFDGDGRDDGIVDAPNPAQQIQLSDIQAAFDWAKTKGELNQPLYIFFTDHGGENRLQLSQGVYIEASELKTMLDDYQKTTGNKVVVIIDACHSGTMVKALAGDNRAVISSTGDGVAYFDRLNGQSFIWYVTKGLNKGMNFSEAFYYASSEYKKTLGKVSQYESISAGSDTLNLTQEPQFDDNGDGLYNISVDGNWLKTVSVNGTWSNADVTLTVEAVTQSGTILNSNTQTMLKANASLAKGRVNRVWAVIRPPKMDILFDSTTGTPILAFPKIDLSSSTTEGEENIYQGSWNGFVYNGEYEITFYAEDNDKNIESSESIILTVADGLACPERGSLKVSASGNSINDNLANPDAAGKIVYKSGDKLKISVTENLAYGYDLYAALFMPDGNFTAIKNTLTNVNISYLQKENFNRLYWGDRWIETNRNINMGRAVDVVDLTLPQEKLPSGQYCVYAALIPEGQDLVAAANKGLIVLDGVCFEVGEE